MIDKLTVKFISYITNKASDICNQSGKKTISVAHLVDALQKQKLESHIKRLFSELDMNIYDEDNDFDKKELKEIKNTINNKKANKGKNKKGKKIEMTEEMIQEQMMLFEKSKIEAYEMMLQDKVETEQTLIETEVKNDLIEEDYD